MLFAIIDGGECAEHTFAYGPNLRSR